MKQSLSRRNFFQSGALIAAACATSSAIPSLAEPASESGKSSPIHLGVASYTFRNFSRAQVIGFMKQLNLSDLNCKDTKDHLPMDPALEAQALADYSAAGCGEGGEEYGPANGLLHRCRSHGTRGNGRGGSDPSGRATTFRHAHQGSDKL